jgi:uncharacterized membrane protein YkvA (DUF1232 family)
MPDNGPTRRIGGLLGMLNLHHTARVFLAAQLDRRVPLWLKVCAWSGMVYVFSPLDVMPELFTGIALLDDIIFSLIIMQSFLETIPPEVVEDHCARLGIKPEQVFISVPQTIREARSIYTFMREFGSAFKDGAGAPLYDAAAGNGSPNGPESEAAAASGPGPGARYSAYRDREDNPGKEPR